MIIAIKVQLNGIDKISDKRQEKEFLLLISIGLTIVFIWCFAC